MVLSISLSFPIHQCMVQVFITRGLYGSLSFLPLSLLASCVQVPACCTKKQCCTIQVDTTHCGFGFHHICSQRPTPVLSASAYFNKFVVLVHTYSVCVVNFVRSRVPSFLPSYSDRVRVRVSFHSLSQFYGSRNPRAPVSVVVFVLFARAETQQRINVSKICTREKQPR